MQLIHRDAALAISIHRQDCTQARKLIGVRLCIGHAPGCGRDLGGCHRSVAIRVRSQQALHQTGAVAFHG